VTSKRKPGGHPAKQDPDVAKLFKTMRATVELVQDLKGKVSDDADVNLRAAALGMMHTYAELTGLPTPNDILGAKQ